MNELRKVANWFAIYLLLSHRWCMVSSVLVLACSFTRSPASASVALWCWLVIACVQL